MRRSRYPLTAPRHKPLRSQPVPHPPPPLLNVMLGNALAHHQQGHLADAEPIYRQILAIDPNHAGCLHLLGTLAHQVGRNDIAVELIGKAVAIDKRQAAYHSNLGTALQALGRLDDAAASYQMALALMPDLAEAHMNLGAVLVAQDKLDEAAGRFRHALELRPDLAEVHVNLGNILQAQGKLDEAVASHERALSLKPDLAEACFNLGNVQQAQGKLNEAVASYERALAIRPRTAEFHGNLGNALLAQEKLTDAEASYARALALNPNYAEANYNLGNLRQAQDKLSEAAACYERAIALKPDLAEAHYNLGNTRQAQNDFIAAAGCYERALAIKPTYAQAHYNLGCVLQGLGCVDEALASYSRAVEIQPDYAQARFGHALAQLLNGEFEAGWRNYESRWQSPDHDTPMRNYAQSLWTGEKLERGRLLLWGEQGVGDEIMFAGLIPDAIRTGNRIVLDCDARLKALFERSFPEIEVASGPRDGPDSPPAAVHRKDSEVEAHVPIGSLPKLFRSAESDFTATTSPYLKADSKQRDEFRARYDDGRRLIGLAWHTSSAKTGRKRSIDLTQLAPLFALPGIQWISLQYGSFDALEEQAAAACAPLRIDRSVDQFADMDRFAAQVAAMDQVITIDNSTAHLAGALAIPTWLMMPFASDWRWLQGSESSPWYPTLRLFRQPQIGSWTAVVGAIARELRSSLALR
jgi:tetratricopeptide (TPR) repeat protein